MAFGVRPRPFWASTEVSGALGRGEGAGAGPVSRIAAGARIRIVDDAGHTVPWGETGELLLRSDCLAAG